jgi:hypothetical protein
MAIPAVVATLACGRGEVQSETDWRREPQRAASEQARPLTHHHGSGTTLVDDTFPILAEPYEVSQDRAGRYFITDLLDKDVKVYDTAGRRVGSVGRAGVAAGEFVGLGSAQVYHDSVLALDPIRQTLSVFASDGRFVRSLMVPPPRVSAVRVVDDSLWLLVAATAAGPHLIRLLHPDGQVAASFFSRPDLSRTNSFVLQHLFLLADGSHDRVVVGLVGGDSVYVYSTRGVLLASGSADPVLPLRSYATLLEGNAGRPRHRDGSWYFDGARVLFKVVASREGVHAFVAPYDTQKGTDLAEGGTVLSFGIAGGSLRVTARMESDAGLLGRSAVGSLLYVGYADSTHRRYEVHSAAPISTMAERAGRAR